MRKFALRSVVMSFFIASGVNALKIRFDEGSILMDSEVNEYLQEFSRPLIKKTNISKINFFIVFSSSANAFTSSDSIFINTEMIMVAESALEFVSVLAHEIGHMASGHSLKMLEEAKRSFYKGLIPAVIGAIAAGVSGKYEAIAPGLMIAPEMFHLSMCGFSRDQESEADDFAIRTLKNLSWPLSGFSRVLEKFSQMEKPIDGTPWYWRTHPFSSDRLHTVMSHQKLEGSKFPKKLIVNFQKMKAKTVAYCAPLSEVFDAIEGLDVPESIKLYARAIAYYRTSDFSKALDLLDKFEGLHPESAPFINELRADILFQSQDIKGAVAAIKKAIKLHPKDPSLLAFCSQIFIESGDTDNINAAIVALRKVLLHFSASPELWRYLGIAYSKIGKKGRMHYCFAESYLSAGEAEKALYHAKIAMKALPPSDLYYQKAREIADLAQPK